ncbi:hypothetical protein ABFS82_12G074300 [Erythranthe guttata]|uniref:Bifunctional inhibitor/plant lipid transfer protein/seed storage helical domain-containing protein n=1 Tax=Erythranthe guttata TaxID=4155 RepID=A0A022RKR0_ERYGU|nr:hypothetical protein MIMGU_mgv1a017556mg [Erythranthe guttata]
MNTKIAIICVLVVLVAIVGDEVGVVARAQVSCNQQQLDLCASAIFTSAEKGYSSTDDDPLPSLSCCP